MVQDPIGVVKFGLTVQLPGPAAKAALRSKVHEAERELQHIASALAKIKRGLDTNDQRQAADGAMDLRNWGVSFVESQSYIQAALGETYSNHIQLGLFMKRAVDLGRERSYSVPR